MRIPSLPLVPSVQYSHYLVQPEQRRYATRSGYTAAVFPAFFGGVLRLPAARTGSNQSRREQRDPDADRRPENSSLNGKKYLNQLRDAIPNSRLISRHNLSSFQTWIREPL
jgi:hypothetical protein